ncbi:MAG TPA: P-II family nitrogen regulator [Terriglobia bacterium]|nr:P-II family nitrogen regulator [Terriglobia bacterium]
MKLITAIIRHEKVEEVKEALTRIKVTGMTVREVRGHGRQKGHKAVYHGAEYSLTLLPKAMLETVVPDDIADQVVTTIVETARTGEIGDGRVFVYPVEHSYNVRTGEQDAI